MAKNPLSRNAGGPWSRPSAGAPRFAQPQDGSGSLPQPSMATSNGPMANVWTAWIGRIGPAAPEDRPTARREAWSTSC